MQYLELTYTDKLFVVYLELTFDGVPCMFIH